MCQNTSIHYKSIKIRLFKSPVNIRKSNEDSHFKPMVTYHVQTAVSLYLSTSLKIEKGQYLSWVYFLGLGDIIETESKFDCIVANKF